MTMSPKFVPIWIRINNEIYNVPELLDKYEKNCDMKAIIKNCI